MQCTPNQLSFETLALSAKENAEGVEGKKAGAQVLVPVYTKLLADFLTPAGAYAILSEHAGTRGAFLFESVTGGEHVGRYSFVGANPLKTITAYEDTTTITQHAQYAKHAQHAAGEEGDNEDFTETIPTPEDPLTLIEAELESTCVASIPGLPRFTGGMVGYLGYPYIHRIEPTVPRAASDPLGVPLACWMRFETIVIFDHVEQTATLCTHAAPGQYTQATERLSALASLLSKPIHLPPMQAMAPNAQTEGPKLSSNTTQAAYEEKVQRVKDYILNGDVIQTVLSQRFEANYPNQPGSALQLYRALRYINPSPYLFILKTPSMELVGASPEMHVRLDGGEATTHPIAGTRRRGKDAQEDAALEADLLADPKERAEHLMLVDLARNDLGRVSQTGSVHVAQYAKVEHYSHVMHIVSEVTSKLNPRTCSATNLMRATFPAGTLSGAPKVRAMQIISELEGENRGAYGGAVGYFDFKGNLDCCIAIRTAMLHNNKLYIQSGAGIVADSNPTSEYTECINKAQALARALTIAMHSAHTHVETEKEATHGA